MADMSTDGSVAARKRGADDEVPARAVGKKKRGHNKFQKVDTLQTAGITFTKANSAPQLVMSKDFKEVTGEKGYRMARTGHGVSSGNWYWECEILAPEKPEAPAHWRLGWSQKQGDLQAPVGYDKWSYAYRDIDGSRVHESVREDGWAEGYGPGDVIGFLICLPYPPDHAPDYGYPSTTPLTAARGRGGQSPPRTRDPSVLALGNHIRFFKNGKDLGVAYSQIPSGTYFPAVSLYMGGRVRANFGPTWLREPIYRGPAFRAMSDLQELLLKREEMDPAQQLQILQQQALLRARGKRAQARQAPRPTPPQAVEPKTEEPEEKEAAKSAEEAADTAKPAEGQGEEAQAPQPPTEAPALAPVEPASEQVSEAPAPVAAPASQPSEAAAPMDPPVEASMEAPMDGQPSEAPVPMEVEAPVIAGPAEVPPQEALQTSTDSNPSEAQG